MKILHINCVDYGSTGKIIGDISKLSEQRGYQSYLCTPCISGHHLNVRKIKTSITHEQGIYKRIVKVLGFQYGFAPISTWRILRTIKRIQPDIVHLHSTNCNMVNIYKLVEHLKKHDFAMVVTNHAEFFYTGSCSHSYECDKWKIGCGSCPRYKFACQALWDSSGIAWKKMKKTFGGFRRACIVSVSPFIYSRSIQSPIMHGIPQDTVLNGINTEVFHPYEREPIAKASGDGKIILYVTASFDPLDTQIKGGAYLVQLARRFAKENVQFLVVGPSVDRGEDLPQNIIKIGFVTDQLRLAKLYANADLSIITSKRETFSMPVAESLACGTPLVGFCAGGPESIGMDEFSDFAEFGDLDGLEKLVRKWLNKKDEIGPETISAAAVKKYAGSVMAEKYIDIYRKVISYEDRDINIS